jgi:nucleoside-diphosphate-sugar epimerase
VAGTRHLVSAARKREARRFVLTSTASAYGRQTGPISEDTRSNAATSWINYERSKWLAEEEVRRGVLDGLSAVIVNPCAIFGPFDTSVWGNVFRAIRDDTMKLLPPGAVPVNHANEVARAHIAAAERGRTGENYILGGEALPLAYIFREIAKLMGLELRAPVAPRFVFKSAARVIASIAKWTGRLPEMTPEMAEILCGTSPVASEKAQRELGYRPRPLADCLKDSFQWLKSEGLL